MEHYALELLVSRGNIQMTPSNTVLSLLPPLFGSPAIIIPEARGQQIITGESVEIQIGFIATHWLSSYANNSLVIEVFVQPLRAYRYNICYRQSQF